MLAQLQICCRYGGLSEWVRESAPDMWILNEVLWLASCLEIMLGSVNVPLFSTEADTAG